MRPGLILSMLCLVLAACAAAPVGTGHPPTDGGSVTLWLVAHDGHTGIAIRRADIPAGLMPERGDFPGVDYLEIGWGNREYYYARNQGSAGTVAAIFPSPSVLHVAGFRGRPAGFFRSSEIVELPVSAGGYERLLRYLHDAFERADGAPARALGPGLYGDSRFYPAWESFHLLRTCNVWTARALREAGLPIRDSITMEGVMSQARELGNRVGSPPGAG